MVYYSALAEMTEEFGAAIPLWAQRLLQTVMAENAELEPRIAELKAGTAAKLVAFKNLKEKREKEQELALREETIRVNNEILKRRSSVTTDSETFRQQVEAKLAETRQLELDLHAKSSSLPKLTETLLKVQSELDGLKKQDEVLQATFLKARASATEESRKLSLVSRDWEDYDLLEPIYKIPELPRLRWTGKRADEAPPKAALQRPVSVDASRLEPSPGLLTRAGKSEVIRLLLVDRSSAIVETLTLASHIPLQAIIEFLLRDDPTDPIDDEAKQLFAKGVQNLHVYYGKDVDLLEWLIKFEVARHNDPKLMFMEGTVTHNILSAFALRYGVTYLRDSVRNTIFRILKDDKPYELDSGKVVKNVEWVDLNIKAVKTLAYDLLIEVANSSFKIPLQLRKVVTLLKAEMMRKFPQDAFNMIARFLFDGLFCKAIERPEDCNIDIKDVNEKMRPLLRTLSLMLSRVARGEPFSEDVYLPMNEFVSNYLGLAKKFLTEATKVPDVEVFATLTPTPLTSIIADISNGMAKLSFTHLDIISRRIADMDTLRLYSSKASYFFHDRFKIIQDITAGPTLATLDKSHPFADELFDMPFEENASLVDSIATVSAAKPYFESLANAIVLCSLYKDPTGSHAEAVIRSMLRKEIAGFSNSAPNAQTLTRLINGFGGAMYATFARVLADNILQELIPPLVEGLRKGKYGKLDKKGCGLLAAFVEQVGQALAKAPAPLFRLAAYLTRQVMDPGPGLFLYKFIAQGLDNPVKYLTKQLADAKEREKLSKRITSARLFFLRVATNDPLLKLESKYYAEANPIIKEVNQFWNKACDTWAQQTDLFPTTSTAPATTPAPVVSWEDARAALKTWMDFVDADPAFEMLLARQINTELAYTLGDLFFGWSLPIGSRAATILSSN